MGSIAWEKRAPTPAGCCWAERRLRSALIRPTGSATADPGQWRPGDADRLANGVLVNNVLPGTYTITETVAPLGYVIDADPTRVDHRDARATLTR